MFIDDKLFEEITIGIRDHEPGYSIEIKPTSLVQLIKMGGKLKTGYLEQENYVHEVDFMGWRFKAVCTKQFDLEKSLSELPMTVDRRNEIAYKFLLYQGFGGISLSKIERRTLPNLAKSLSGNISEDELKIFFRGLYSDVFDSNFGI